MNLDEIHKISQSAELVEKYINFSEQGDANAQSILGVMYTNGWGVDQDYNKAVELFQKAVEQKHVKSLVYLGNMYRNGDGIDKDYNKAAQCYLKAAEQGDEEGQNNIGGMYDYGYGVEQNYEEAVNWYRKAAIQGEEDARFNLSVMYKEGLGVKKNRFISCVWLYVYTMNPHNNMVFKELPSNEMEQIKKVANQWIENNFTNCDLPYIDIFSVKNHWLI